MTQQQWSPDTYAANARFVSDLGEPLLALLEPATGMRVLDLGCGDGALTEKLAAAGCEVVAVDASAEQVEGARRRGLDARVGRAETLDFREEFDAVFSNAVLHWVKDQAAALAAIRRALRPGGRMIAELGGFGCVDSIRRALHPVLTARGIDPAAHDPWLFPDQAQYRGFLAGAGLEPDVLMLFDRPTPLPGDITGWLETFAQPFLRALPHDQWAAALADVREIVRPVLQAADGSWSADYVRLRLRAMRVG